MTTIVLTRHRIFADTAATYTSGKIGHVVKIWKRGDRLITGHGSLDILLKFRSGWHRFMLETFGFTICELGFKKEAKNSSTVIILVSEFDIVVYNLRYKQSFKNVKGNRICILYKHQKTIWKFLDDEGWLVGGYGSADAKAYLQRPHSNLLETGEITVYREAIQYAASINKATSKYVLDVEVPKETKFGSILRSFMLFINGETEIKVLP